MRLLVTGVTGQLGAEVMKECERRGLDAVGASRAEMPLTDLSSTRDFLMKTEPDAVIHCAAYTAVDRAEDEPGLCRAINGDATREIARTAAKIGAKMVYISTDYVFPGDGENFYETDDVTAPVNVYGASKLLGEQAVRETLEKFFIVRVSWVFGGLGKNFIRTMLSLARTRRQFRVVDDQKGSPTYAADLAPLLLDMVQTEKYGIYHATNEGVCSWADLASEIFRLRAPDASVERISSLDYPTKAARPKNSRLSKKSLDRAGFRRLPEWRDALCRYLAELDEIDKYTVE